MMENTHILKLAMFFFVSMVVIYNTEGNAIEREVSEEGNIAFYTYTSTKWGWIRLVIQCLHLGTGSIPIQEWQNENTRY